MFGQRVAHKIWLGYTIPLAVLVVAGVLVPAILSAILGRITREADRSARFAERVQAMQSAARDTEKNLRGFLRDGYPIYRDQFRQSRDAYRFQSRAAATLAASAPLLATRLGAADDAYQAWLVATAEPRLRRRALGRLGRNGDAAGEAADAFTRVENAFQRLVSTATQRRDRLSDRAASAERVRHLMTLGGPAVALLLALLIGRSITLGVTRPLEALRAATEALDRGGGQGGQGTHLLDTSDAPDDEIGDLKRAFAHMARTIGQREAVLRAQNEALGALHRRAEAVLNATNDGIVMLDRGGGFSVVNQRFADLFGLDSAALLEQTVDDVGPWLLPRFRSPREVARLLRDILPDPDAVLDETHEIIEPQHRVLRIYSAPVRGEPRHEGHPGDLLGRIFVFRDVTRETTVDRMKTEFVSVVSHELRTPLTAIKGYVDVMLAGQAGPLSELQAEFLTIVESCTGRLTALINDMLDISRIESARTELRRDEVDYAAVVGEAMATLSGEAEAKTLALDIALPDALPFVCGDADRIAQVLINLLSNAIKYTPPGGRVFLRVEPSEGFVTTCVGDTGIGISEEDQARLFLKFFRADNSTTREAGGTGLGLAITKALLEKMHGSIRVESEVGKGSRFYFTLPTAPACDPAASNEAAPNEAAPDALPATLESPPALRS